MADTEASHVVALAAAQKVRSDVLAESAHTGHYAPVSSRPAECCPNLFQVLGGYLHQDFDLDHGRADDALLAAVAGQPPEQVAAAAAELAAHRPSADDEGASRRFTNELCSYHPPGDGLSYSEWLDRVQRVLAGRTGA